MILYSGKSITTGQLVRGDGLENRNEHYFITDSYFNIEEEVIKDTIEKYVVEKDSKGRVIYEGEEKENAFIPQESITEAKARTDIRPLTNNEYVNLYDLGRLEKDKDNNLTRDSHVNTYLDRTNPTFDDFDD